MSSGLINFGHFVHEYSFCTVAVPATPAGATPQAPFCDGPLLFIHQAARSLVIPDGRHGRGWPRLHPCHWVGNVKLGSASPLLLKQPVHDPTNTAIKPLVASPRALPSQLAAHCPGQIARRVDISWCHAQAFGRTIIGSLLAPSLITSVGGQGYNPWSK